MTNAFIEMYFVACNAIIIYYLYRFNKDISEFIDHREVQNTEKDV